MIRPNFAVFGLLFTLALLGCGAKLTSEKKGPTREEIEVWNQKIYVDMQALQTSCQASGGYVSDKAPVCVTAKDVTGQLLGSSNSSGFNAFSGQVLPVSEGNYIQTFGRAQPGSLEVQVDGLRLSAIPNNALVRVTKTGGLRILVRPPGVYEAVQVFLYTCSDASGKPAGCVL